MKVRLDLTAGDFLEERNGELYLHPNRAPALYSLFASAPSLFEVKDIRIFDIEQANKALAEIPNEPV